MQKIIEAIHKLGHLLFDDFYIYFLAALIIASIHFVRELVKKRGVVHAFDTSLMWLGGLLFLVALPFALTSFTDRGMNYDWLFIWCFGFLLVFGRTRYLESVVRLIRRAPPIDICYQAQRDPGRADPFSGSSGRDAEDLRSNPGNLYKLGPAETDKIIAYLKSRSLASTRGVLRNELNSQHKIQALAKACGIPITTIEWVAFSNFAGQGIRDDAALRFRLRLTTLTCSILVLIALGTLVMVKGGAAMAQRQAEDHARTVAEIERLKKRVDEASIFVNPEKPIIDFISNEQFGAPLTAQEHEDWESIQRYIQNFQTPGDSSSNLKSLASFIAACASQSSASGCDSLLGKYLASRVAPDKYASYIHLLQGRIAFQRSRNGLDEQSLQTAQHSFEQIRNEQSQLLLAGKNGALVCRMTLALMYSSNLEEKWSSLTACFRDLALLKTDLTNQPDDPALSEDRAVVASLFPKVMNNMGYVIVEYIYDFVINRNVSRELKEKVTRDLFPGEPSDYDHLVAIAESKYFDVARTHAKSIATYWESLAQLELAKARYELAQNHKVDRNAVFRKLVEGRFGNYIKGAIARHWDDRKLGNAQYSARHHWDTLDSLGYAYPVWVTLVRERPD